MATGRDDFIIAIRSAFLKKGNRQKFSLFTLLVASCLILSLEYFKSGPVDIFRSITRDIIYRGAYIISSPFKAISNTYYNFEDHMNMYEKYSEMKNKEYEINKLQNEINFYKAENNKLREIVSDPKVFSNKFIVTKVIVDKQSPFLKSIIINKGFESGIKKGMPVLEKSYMIGRVVETNYMSSRILLINDLNSKIPVIIEPSNTNAILNGSGKDHGDLEYLPKNNSVAENHIVYTSGSDGIFEAGIPIGKVNIKQDKKIVSFFVDLSQLNFIKIKTNIE